MHFNHKTYFRRYLNFISNFISNFINNFQGRILPEGRHEIPFSYTLPKTLPSSFEGEFGYIRYTCKAICERPWDFDIVSKRAFTVVGIEDINEDPKFLEPATASDCNSSIRFCCRKQGPISAELSLDRSGFTPGEVICVNGKIRNDSQRTLRSSCLRLKQHVNYRAKTFAGSEHVKTSSKVVVKKEKGEIAPLSVFEWNNEKIILPSIPPRLSKCKIIEITYTLELQADNAVTAILPICVGTIPLLADLMTRAAKNGRVESNGRIGQPEDTCGNESDSVVHVTVTDECGQPVSEPAVDDLSPEMEALISSRKRVRMPSSILSELYPTLPSPYYKESHFGHVDITEDKENVQFGEKRFAPKYPFYTD
ncbi:unnamed protein product [Toxocara canis]|uniref:Arrestin C-terminal-like domain-containing protein n=1 Tax=Toxocara canis TaxID=6265 RepID=A0A3P7IRV4_TOXCA|nr:unnamed protein product [Toxocara canis]